jgi:hypothetical protein
MNEQALSDAYQLFTGAGYTGSKDNFLTLINSNEKAFDDAFNLFTQSGYKKSKQDFSNLLGLGKKKGSTEDPTMSQESMGSQLDDGSLVSQEELSDSQQFSNVFKNAKLGLQEAWESTKIASAQFSSYLGVSDEEETDRYIVDQYKKLDEISAKMGDTGKGIVKGVKEGDFADVGIGVVNALTSVITTVAPAMLTRGASLVPQIMAPMYTEYNSEKAKALYGDDEERAIEKLIENNEDEVAVPMALGAASVALEKIGIKGISKYVLNNARTKGARRIADLTLTGNREGLTEYFQGGLNVANKSLAQGDNAETVSTKVFDHLSSENALEEYVQGFVGGAGMSAGGRKINSAFRDKNDNIIVNDYINTLGALNQQKVNSKTEDAKNVVDKKIKKVEQQFKDFLITNQKKSEYLTEEQATEAISILDTKNELNTKLQDINGQLKNGEINKNEHDLILEDINNEFETNNKKLNDIKVEANKKLLQDDLRISNEAISKIRGLSKPKVYKTAEGFLKALNARSKKQYTLDEVKNIDGTVVGKEILINETIAAENNAITVGSHELLHAIVKSSITGEIRKVKDIDGKTVETDLTVEGAALIKDFLNELSSKENKIVQKRIDDNYRYNRNKKGEIVSEKAFEQYAEEYLNSYADAAIKNELNDSLLDKLGKFLQKIFNSGNNGYQDLSFKTGEDVKTFLKAYVSDRKKGQFRQQFVEMAKEGVKQKTTGITKESITARAKEAQETVDKIGKKATTKEEYDAGVNIEAYNYLIDKQGLDGLIIAELNKRGIDTKAEDANVNGVPLNDYMEDVRAKLIPDVLGFNPGKETTSQGKFGLSGYINQRLKFRMGDVATKAKKTVTGKSLETPIGDSGRTVAETIEDKDDASLKAFEEQDLSISAQNRATETEQDKNELKSRYRHKLKNNDGTKLISETRVESIREGIRATLIKLADKVVSPDFLFNFEKIVKKDLKNIVQKAIGTKKQYKQFVLKNMRDIVDFTSVQDLVALERLVGQGKLKGGKKIFTVAVKRLTKIKDIQKAINEGKLPPDAINKSEQGVMLNEKRMPTQDEIKAFFFGENMQEVLGYKLGSSTLGTRKDGLSRMIITEVTQDGLMETIQEPDVAEEILSISEEAHIDVIVKNVATQVNRSPDLKFSKTSLESIIKDPTAGKDIKRGAEIIIKQGYESKAWKKFIDDDKVNNKVKLELNINYLQRQSENWYTVRKLVGAKVLKSMGNIPTYKKFEKLARNVAQNIFNKEGYTVANLTETNNAPDVIIYKQNNRSLEIGVEVKGTTARGSSKSYNSKKGKGFERDNTTDDFYSENAKTKVDNLLNKANKRIEKILKDLNIKPTYNKNGNLVITEQQKKQLKRKRLHLSKQFVEFINTKDVEVMYLNKEGKDGKKRPSHYINLGVSGLMQMGNQNLLNIEGINKFGDFDINIPMTVRFTFNKTTAGVRVGVRIEPQLDSRFFPKQNANLFNAKNPNVKIKKSITKDVSTANNLVKASRSDMSKPKGASIFDFDETVGISENFVIATKEGITKRISSEQWPLVGETLKEQGYKFDFTDFNKVTKGRPGPLLQKMKNQIEKYGSKNVFILTARAPESQQAIHDWLKSEGVNIPLENITGLGNSTAEAKASWVLDKYANKSYNDIYFVDDALQNVQAVQNMFDQLDVKGKSVQAKVKFSKNMNNDFNKILEEVTGIESKKRFMQIKARKRGESKGKFRFFIPPSHEDFVGLLYNFMGEGRKGDQHRNFFEQALVKPLNRAYREIDTAKQAIANDYKALNKKFKDIKNKLRDKTPDGDFIFEDAIRVYLWNKHGYSIEGLSEIDQANLVELVMNDPNLRQYAEAVDIISKQDKYVEPGKGWEGGNIQTDLIDATGRVGRAKYFTEFNENVDILFSEENLNKIEAGYGADFRSALEDMLHRIKTGVNRPKGQHATVNKLMNYLNGSVGTVMFFNVRSAILQQMSIVNYINFADNNIFAAAKAFANQKQYWADFAFIFNSDMLKQRRGGVGTDINGNDLAQAVAGSKNPTKVVISRLLKLGFLPTQIGDNIAIATGGATFYRNRVNKYKKDGMSQKEAEAAAFTDFQDLTQSTQQSSRPDMTSQQQASWIGKLILNFQNITSQYNRIIKKAALDIGKGRISPPYTTKAQSNLGNLSKILYYGGIQNVLFYSLQTALFAVMFDDDKDEDQILKKKERVIQGTIDSILRGSGIYGAVASTLKNAVIKWKEQREKGYNKDESGVLMELLNFSPVVGIKSRMIVNAEKTINYNENVISEMETFDAENPMWSAVTNYTQALTNFPANRLYQKSINMRNALDKDYTNFQRIMFFSGYTTWSLGLGDSEAVIEAKEKVKINKANTKKKKKKRKQLPMY